MGDKEVGDKGPKEAVEKAISGLREVEGKGNEPRPGQDPDRRDLTNPAGHPKVDGQHTNPIQGTEREWRNQPGRSGDSAHQGGAPPSNTQRQATREEIREDKGGGKGNA